MSCSVFIWAVIRVRTWHSMKSLLDHDGILISWLVNLPSSPWRIPLRNKGLINSLNEALLREKLMKQSSKQLAPYLAGLVTKSPQNHLQLPISNFFVLDTLAEKHPRFMWDDFQISVRWVFVLEIQLPLASFFFPDYLWPGNRKSIVFLGVLNL